MKKLSIKNVLQNSSSDFVDNYLEQCRSKREFVSKASDFLSNLTIEFYEYIGIILKHIGIENPHVTREGDVNCRFDATIIDTNNTIPIEIKSPREVREINIKSIRQAFENKIVLLSRRFYPTTDDTTSLVIAFDYPPTRSDVYELIEDIKKSFNYNIGIINVDDLLMMVYSIEKEGKSLNYKYFNYFQGKIDYEKALS